MSQDSNMIEAAQGNVEDKLRALRRALEVLREVEGKPSDRPCDWCCDDNGVLHSDGDSAETEAPDCSRCKNTRRIPLSWPWVVTGATIAQGEGEGAASSVLQPCILSRGAKWVSIRPVDKKYKGKTFLGILLGDLALSVTASLNRDSGLMTLEPTYFNPAIYVPDLHRVICGVESWWGRIKSPEDLRAISDGDIQNVWYMRALEELSGGDSDE